MNSFKTAFSYGLSILAIFGIILISANSLYSEVLFGSAVNYDAGGLPHYIYASDLDNDGYNDVIVANYDSDNISILMNNGDGTFQSQINYAVVSSPISVFSADIDGDGDNDIAVAGYESGPNNVSILLNTGDGSFQAPVKYSTGSSAVSVFLIDIDSDNDNDLIVTNGGSNNVSIFINSGEGTYSSPTNYSVGSFPKSVYSIDLDNDNDNDLAVANYDSDNISLLMNNGDGTFQSQIIYNVGTDPWSIFSKDLDNDGDNDLIVANAGSDNVSVLMNNGDGTFLASVYYDVGNFPHSVYASDFDNNGYYDLVTANTLGGDVSVLMNNGHGIFQLLNNIPVGLSPTAVFASDLDNDGDPDLAVANSYTNNISILLNMYIPDVTDTLYIPAIHSNEPELIIPMKFACQTPTAAYQVSLCWEPADFELKSVSFAGTAVDSWGFKGQIIDNENQNVLIYAAVGQDFDYILTGEDTVLAYLHFANPLNTYDSVCILEPFTSTDSLALVLDTCTINGDGLLFGDTTTDPGPVPFYPYIAFDTSWAYSYPDYSYIPGDVNCDQAVNLIDILYLINYKYKNPPGPAPMPPSSGDVNADCDINLLDILYFIDYKYGTPAGPELLCGCVESSPLNKIGSTMQKYSDAPYGGAVSTEYADGKTFIKLDAADVIKGIEMEIRLPDISANVSCPIERMQVYSRRENGMIKLAVFDINGQNRIEKGLSVLLEINGEAEIVSAFAGGMNAEPLYLEIAGNNTDSPQLPDKFALHQNHPNPFNPVTQISFELPVEAHVTLDVYNIMGQKVSTIADRRFAPGYHTVEWDGSSFASGVYFYRIQAGDAIETRKMMLLK